MLSIAALTALLPFLGAASTIPLEARQTCQDQSCVLAALSGSSPTPLSSFAGTNVTGGSDAGTCCIILYNPNSAPYIYAERPDLKATCAKDNANQTTTPSALALAYIKERVAAAPCANNTLIYAKGTFEPFEYGVSVGPQLAGDLAEKGYTTIGVEYANTVMGDDCVGRPGGTIMTGLLNGIVEKCPNTKVALSGYSEGAMVTHNGLAFANKASKTATKAVVVFGDPMDGAKIRGYDGEIKTFCASGDGVCQGAFNITAAHLSYADNGDVGMAATFIEQTLAAAK